MKLKLSEQALANMYPTGRGKNAAKRTFLDALKRDVKAGEVVEVSDKELAADYVASGLLEPADAASATAVNAELERKRAAHQTAADKIKAELDADKGEMEDDRRAYLERQLASEEGYCASFQPRAGTGAKKAAEPQAKES